MPIKISLDVTWKAEEKEEEIEWDKPLQSVGLSHPVPNIVRSDIESYLSHGSIMTGIKMDPISWTMDILFLYHGPYPLFSPWKLGGEEFLSKYEPYAEKLSKRSSLAEEIRVSVCVPFLIGIWNESPRKSSWMSPTWSNLTLDFINWLLLVERVESDEARKENEQDGCSCSCFRESWCQLFAWLLSNGWFHGESRYDGTSLKTWGMSPKSTATNGLSQAEKYFRLYCVSTQHTLLSIFWQDKVFHQGSGERFRATVSAISSISLILVSKKEEKCSRVIQKKGRL